MLTPEYLQGCADEVVKMYERLNQSITDDICRRIIKTGVVTDTAAWQAKQLQECGKLMEDIIADVALATGKTSKEIETMFRNAGVASMKFDAAPLLNAGLNVDTGMSPSMMNVLEANLRKTQGDMLNLTMTTASSGQDTFVQAMNEAVMKIESGAYDYQTAIRQAVDRCAVTGARVLYGSGASIGIEAAARSNILTAVNQTAAEITMMNGERLGCEYYEVSAHAGARLEHTYWQGQVYKIDGVDADHENFYEATEYGEVTGLCGVNCRHSFYPFFPEVSKPAYTKEMLESYERPKYEYNGDMLTEYEVSQLDRRYERAIRDSKRTISAYEESIKACTDPVQKKELEKALAARKSTYNARRERWTDFKKQTGTKKDYLRTRVSVPVKSSDYLTKDVVAGADTKAERAVFRAAYDKCPQKVKDAIDSCKIVEFGQIGASQYDYGNDIIKIAMGTNENGALHEIGHLIDNKLIPAERREALFKEATADRSVLLFGSEIFEDNAKNEVEVFLYKGDKFVSEYQGRLYVDNILIATDAQGNVRTDTMLEFISEGFREYIQNPENLKEKFLSMYNLFEEVLK